MCVFVCERETEKKRDAWSEQSSMSVNKHNSSTAPDNVKVQFHLFMVNMKLSIMDKKNNDKAE